MALPESIIHSMEKVVGDSEQMENLNELCDKLCFYLLEDNCSKWDESLCNFEFAQIVWSVFIEATKRSLEVGAMKDLLPNSRLKDEIVRNYEMHGPRLKEVMASIGWEWPEVIDFDWKLSQIIESNKGKEKGVVVEMHFDTVATGFVSVDRISFSCDINDLQLMLWKFKEARNSIEKLRKA